MLGCELSSRSLAIGLGVGIVVDARAPAIAEDGAAALTRTAAPAAALSAGCGRALASPGAPAGAGPRRLSARRRHRAAPGRRLVVVLDAFRVRAAVALELRLDPVDGGAVAIGSLTAIAELRQALDRGLVLFQIESADEHPYRVVVVRGLRGWRGCRRRLDCARAPAPRASEPPQPCRTQFPPGPSTASFSSSVVLRRGRASAEPCRTGSVNVVRADGDSFTMFTMGRCSR